MNRRDHRKILIVDNLWSFTGGINIADDYAAKEEGGENWRDTHVRMTGVEPARILARLFNQTWQKAEVSAGPSLFGHSGVSQANLASPVGNETSSNVAVQILNNKEFLLRVRMRRAYMRAIRQATTTRRTSAIPMTLARVRAWCTNSCLTSSM